MDLLLWVAYVLGLGVSEDCTANINGLQFDQRPSSQLSCGQFNSLIQSYCDASDPYCSDGDDPATHEGYGSEYGSAALAFVKTKLTS